MTTHPTPAAQMQAEPYPASKALEFAEYLAKGAERLLADLESEDKLRTRREESDDVDSDTIYDAALSRGETASSLRGDIYEFRKRAAKAAAAPTPQPQANSPAIPDGWRIEPGDDGTLLITAPSGNACGVRADAEALRVFPELVLHELASALLAAPPAPAPAAAQPVAPFPDAWQERQQRTHTTWTDWYDSPTRVLSDPRESEFSGIKYQWRPLYAPPPAAPVLKESLITAAQPLAETQEREIPADVLEAAQSFVDNGYRGPLPWAKKVFDWVVSHSTLASPAGSTKER